MFFSKEDYDKLKSLAFSEDYKAFSQIDKEYDIPTRKHSVITIDNLEEKDIELIKYYTIAFNKSIEIAKELDVPENYYPDFNSSKLRVIEYPPEAGTGTKHYDHSLFTLTLYRDVDDAIWTETPPVYIHDIPIYYGLLIDEIGMGRPTFHQVLPKDMSQHSIVFFAIPSKESIRENRITRNITITARRKYPTIPGRMLRKKHMIKKHK